MTDLEIAELITTSENPQELLANPEIFEKLSDPIFLGFLFKYIRAKAIISLPRMIDKLVDDALDGKVNSARLILDLLNINLEQDINQSVDIDTLKAKIERIINEQKTK